MRIDLSGRTALVTGSTQGIGRVIAERLADAGATTWVNGRTAERVAAWSRRCAPRARPARRGRRRGRRDRRGRRGGAPRAPGGRHPRQQPRHLRAAAGAGDRRRRMAALLGGQRAVGHPAHARLPAGDARARLGPGAVPRQRLGGGDPGGDGPLRRHQDGAARRVARLREGDGRHGRDGERGDGRPDAHRGRRDVRRGASSATTCRGRRRSGGSCASTGPTRSCSG